MKKSALFPILLCFGTLFSCNLCMAAGKMTLLGSRMYITTDQIFVYDLDTQTLEQLPVSHSVNEYDDIIPMPLESFSS